MQMSWSFMNLVKGPWEKNGKIFVFGEFHALMHFQKSFTWQDDNIWLIVVTLESENSSRKSRETSWTGIIFIVDFKANAAAV